MSIDIPTELKQKVVDQLEKFKCVLDNQVPIGYGSFGCVYRARRIAEGDILAVKAVLIPKMIAEERETLLRSICQEVILFK